MSRNDRISLFTGPEKFLLFALLAGGGYWFFDGLLDYLSFNYYLDRLLLSPNLSFLDALILHVPPQSLARRILLLSLFLLGGFHLFRHEKEHCQRMLRLEKHNQTLEKTMLERTEEMERANRELEAFSYSVSHDLRAPLRTLEGFSQILLEEYAPSLEEKAREHLERIRKGSLAMGEMIDDLLRLSRISKGTLHLSLFSLSDSAEQIARDLQETDPSRKVAWKIEPDIFVQGDPGLLRCVLFQLLENAWKFSSLREESRISLGKQIWKGMPAYFVRDNGTGFDMRYREKLFLPFERLHSREIFPGTGIGLTTVQRIIERHRGSLWAEGHLDEGATFYFTLWEKGGPHEGTA